jgi:hypothetical protein
MNCCCSRKTTDQVELQKIRKEYAINNHDLSDIYELVMTPCETSSEMPENMPTTLPINTPPNKKNVYINLFEDEQPLTPKFSTSDTNDNMIHVKIPRGSELYVNYNKYNYLDK